ncbi:unnamed protein product [Clonostachys rhizophaga]|uniref:Oxidoreductase n=1 Tax=Clonostachys rhizophaga TaxID=160324 RepID=A0A9N9VKI1_9HYPO|nr:unnamed protein product [Clonostachys rhizophaga]
MSSIKVGIIGYGNATKTFHLPFIKTVSELEVYAILQRSEAPADPSSSPKGSHCTVDFPNIKHYRTAEDFFADKNIDLVVVATHTDTHASFAKQAVEAGKHVISDKPFATSAEEADEVIKAAEKSGKIATCYQNRRWDGDFQTLLDLKNKNAFGDIKEAEIHYDFESPDFLKHLPAKYTPGGGLAFGLGTHSVYHAYTLFGRPSSVTGFYRVYRDATSEVEDTFTIILQYGDDPLKGRLVTVKTAVVTPMAQQLKYWVRGTKGSYIKFQKRSFCPQEEDLAVGKGPADPDYAKEAETYWGTLTTYDEFDSSIQKFEPEINKYTGQVPTIRGNFSGVYQNLARAILGKEELVVKLPDVRDCLRILELARESHEKGTTVTWR